VKPVWYLVDPRFPEQLGRRVVCRGPASSYDFLYIEPVTDDYPYMDFKRYAIPIECLVTQAEWELVRDTRGI
jgi:hypothetical protein